MGPPAEIHIVPHTHWDREWYLPCAVYRRRLVGLIDDLLRVLRDEPGLRFHLDGQMALVDDYLEIRPWRGRELREAAEAGRVSLGPWYTLPDEHLVSGECLLRNLELGLERARTFAPGAEPMLVGYLPDQFGHTAQLPQLLRRFGIRTAVLWRGVPGSVGSSVFTWAALDGSELEVVHLRRGYGHGREMPVDPVALAQRLDAEVAWQVAHNRSGPWLVMSGDDHQPVPAGLTRGLAQAAPTIPARISTLADYAAHRPPARERVRGELYSAATSWVLEGTLSARYPLKLRHAALERRLERYVEPAWTLSGLPWPERELRYAWRQLILNSAHDSICGCSIDQVHEEATRRLERAERVVDALWNRLGSAPGLVFNPSPHERAGVPPLGCGPAPRLRESSAGPKIEIEDVGDRGDEYTHEPVGEPRRAPAPAFGTEVQAFRVAGEEWTRLRITVDNRRPDHRIRLLAPADTAAGGWAGTAFGAVRRRFRKAGGEAGRGYDVPTGAARGWVLTGRTLLMVPGPFEYELLEGAIAVTLLRCVGRLARDDLTRRSGPAGPGVATPGAQMLGRHRFHFAIAEVDGLGDALRLYEEFAHPLQPAPGVPLRGFEPLPAGSVLSALRRVGGRAQLRTWSAAGFRIEDRWLD